MSKENKVKDKDGKGSGCCCGTIFGCSIILLIIIILFTVFIVRPVWREYGDTIESSSIYDKARNILGDKIDEWNNRYIRGTTTDIKDMVDSANSKMKDIKGATEDGIDKATDKAKEYYDNPKVIIEDTNNLLPEPLIKDNFEG